MTRVIRSELLKIRTTNTWWLMTLGILGFTGLALLVNCLTAHSDLARPDPHFPADMPARDQEQLQAEVQQQYADAHSAAGLAKIAANIYTSGQFMGIFFVLVLGALIVTNEYFHQTATATFLTTPTRTVVIGAKLVAGIIFGLFAWLLTTVVSVATGVIFLGTEHVANSLGAWTVTRSVLLNLAAFAIWSVLGIALGTLIRSQIAAVVTGAVLYLVGMSLFQLAFLMVHEYSIKEDWVLTAQVAVPAMASTVMVTPGEAFPYAPPQWVGAAVLIGYGLVAGVIGTLITRKRDIS